MAVAESDRLAVCSIQLTQRLITEGSSLVIRSIRFNCTNGGNNSNASADSDLRVTNSDETIQTNGTPSVPSQQFCLAES